MKKNILLSLICILILSACSYQKTPLPPQSNVPAVTGEDFSVIVLPDTQNEVQDFPNVYMSQVDWILANTEKLKIASVVHVGDQVNVATDEKQWRIFEEGIKKLDEKNIPVLLALGNHDHPSTLYDKYFPISRYSHQAWWGGQMGYDTDNKYILLTLAGEKYIFISLDFCPTKEEIQWGNDILTKYADHKALLSTHAFLDQNAGRKPHVCTDTQYIWDDFVKLHKNLQLVVSGHVHTENRRIDKNNAGNTVYQMLADFQEDTNGGNAWLRVLTFKTSENKISVKTYSPFLGTFQEDTESQFELDYNFKRSVPDSASSK